MPRRIEERVRPITPQLAWRVAVLGGIAFVLFGIVFFRLWYLQVLSGQDYVVPGEREPPAQGAASRRRAATSWTATARRSWRPSAPRSCRSSRPRCRRPCSTRPTSYRKALAAAENERLAAADRYEAYSRQLRDDGRKIDQAREAPAQRSCKQGVRAAPARSRSRRRPQSEVALNRLYRRMGEVLDIRPSTIHERVIRGVADTPFSNVTIRTDVDPAEFNYMRERPGVLPGRRGHAALPAPVPARRARRAAVRHDLRDHRGAAQGQGLRRDRAGHADRPERPGGRVRQVPARRRRLQPRRGRRVRQPRRGAPAVGARAQAGPAAEADARLRPAEGGRRGAVEGDLRLAARRQGRRVHRDGPARRRDPRHGLAARLRRQRLRAPVLAADLRGPDLAGQGRAADQPRDRVGLSDRLGVQADHGAGGARVGRHRAQGDDQRHRQVRARPAEVPERQGRGASARSTSSGRSRSPRTSSSTTSASGRTRRAA